MEKGRLKELLVKRENVIRDLKYWDSIDEERRVREHRPFYSSYRVTMYRDSLITLNQEVNYLRSIP